MGQYEQAVVCWMEKVTILKTPIESTWLYHEIGRCHMELGNFQDARDFGRKSLVAGAEAKDEVWQLNASVLVAQAEGTMF